MKKKFNVSLHFSSFNLNVEKYFGKDLTITWKKGRKKSDFGDVAKVKWNAGDNLVDADVQFVTRAVYFDDSFQSKEILISFKIKRKLRSQTAAFAMLDLTPYFEKEGVDVTLELVKSSQVLGTLDLIVSALEDKEYEPTGNSSESESVLSEIQSEDSDDNSLSLSLDLSDRYTSSPQHGKKKNASLSAKRKYTRKRKKSKTTEEIQVLKKTLEMKESHLTESAKKEEEMITILSAIQEKLRETISQLEDSNSKLESDLFMRDLQISKLQNQLDKYKQRDITDQQDSDEYSDELLDRQVDDTQEEYYENRIAQLEKMLLNQQKQMDDMADIERMKTPRKTAASPRGEPELWTEKENPVNLSRDETLKTMMIVLFYFSLLASLSLFF